MILKVQKSRKPEHSVNSEKNQSGTRSVKLLFNVGGQYLKCPSCEFSSRTFSEMSRHYRNNHHKTIPPFCAFVDLTNVSPM
jgi:hypothetical protein